jgi:hypothetical protein
MVERPHHKAITQGLFTFRGMRRHDDPPHCTALERSSAALDRVKFSAEIIAANHEASAHFSLF